MGKYDTDLGDSLGESPGNLLSLGRHLMSDKNCKKCKKRKKATKNHKHDYNKLQQTTNNKNKKDNYNKIQNGSIAFNVELFCLLWLVSGGFRRFFFAHI